LGSAFIYSAHLSALSGIDSYLWVYFRTVCFFLELGETVCAAYGAAVQKA